ncbi:MAG: hypothetical protein J6X00_00085 [Clostridia bacterium]|nr:hypothetical protein [Clostridia bacterium]
MKEMLEYQKLEIELNKLKKNADNVEAKNVMAQMASYVKDAQNKSGKLESDASKLLSEYETLKANYDKTTDQVNNILKNDVGKMSAEEVTAMFGEVNKLSSDLFMLERKLNFIITNAKQLLKNFEITRNNVKKAKIKHREAKEQLDETIKSYEPKIAEVEKKLAELEKKVDKTLLAKYKTLKSENVFPVFVPLTQDACGGCRMNIPTSRLSKLNADGYITCEHCGRIIYIQK